MDIATKLYEIIAEQLGISADEIQRDAFFGKDLGADSLDICELMMALEEEFDIDIPEIESKKIETVEGLIRYLEGHTQ